MSNAQVVCYSGNKYPQEPRGIIWGGKRLQVEQVLSSTQTPTGPTFIVQVEDERLFALEYNDLLDEWNVQLV
jgi:hypothetical protein